MSNRTTSTTSTMGRSLSPSLRRELENLDKDADSRKSAMKALKSYVKDLDSKAIPLFLARVSETKDAGSSYGEYTISLYEVLARVHGPKIAPQIDNIMNTIIKTLDSSAGSFALQQACSKVVPAIARYGIDPTMDEDKKRHVIHSLCKPLSDSLMFSSESLSSGSALCLKALVDSDNWRFASNDMVNEVCQRVSAAIEKPVQPNSHIGLVMALAKHNSFIMEAYARLLIHSGLRIANVVVSEKKSQNSQNRLSAIQMVNFLMKSLDPKCFSSEMIPLIISKMESFQSDEMPYVSGAAYECLQTARRTSMEICSKVDKKMSYSATGSNFDSNDGDCRRRNFWQGSGDPSPAYATSPESHTISSFVRHDSLMESPISVSSFLGEYDRDRPSVNRKLWRKNEDGGVDVSLKDGLYSEASRGRSVVESNELLNSGSDYLNGFAGFFQENPLRSTIRSPQRSGSQISAENFKIFETPRKLIHSLQDDSPGSESMSNSINSGHRSLSYNKCGCTPISKYDQSFSPNSNAGSELNKNSGQYTGDSSESVSSTEDINVVNGENLPTLQAASETETGTGTQSHTTLSSNFESPTKSMTFGLIVIFIAVFLCWMRMSDQGEGRNLVPT